MNALGCRDTWPNLRPDGGGLTVKRYDLVLKFEELRLSHKALIYLDMNQWRGKYCWNLLIAFWCCLAVSFPAAAMDPDWRPVPVQRYFGIFGNAGWACEFRFDVGDELEGTAYSGRISYPKTDCNDPPHPPAPFTYELRFVLEQYDGVTWRMSWDEGPRNVPHYVEMRWIDTVLGPCLAGIYSFWYSPKIPTMQRLILLWPDPNVSSNPLEWSNSVPLEAIDSEEENFEIWTSNDGLATDATRAIAQTSDGYIWVGTVEGVSRFDGTTWTNFSISSDPPFPAYVASCLAEDHEGRLLIGTKGSGLYRYDGDRFEPSLANHAIGQKDVGTVVVGTDGAVWLAMEGNRLGRIDSAGQFESWNIDELNPIYNGYMNDRGTYLSDLVPTASGVRLSVQGNWLSLERDGAEISYGMMFTAFGFALTPASDGGYWWFSNGLVRIGPDDLVAARYDTKIGGKILEARDRSVWWEQGYPSVELLRFTDDRLYRFPKVTETLDSTILDMVEDHEGNIWLATGASGVGRFRPALVSSLTEGKGVPRDGFRTLALNHRGELCVGATNLGVLTKRETGWDEMDVNQTEQYRADEDLINGQLRPFTHESICQGLVEREVTWVGLTMSVPREVLTNRLDLLPPYPILARLQGEAIEFFTPEEFEGDTGQFRYRISRAGCLRGVRSRSLATETR